MGSRPFFFFLFGSASLHNGVPLPPLFFFLKNSAGPFSSRIGLSSSGLRECPLLDPPPSLFPPPLRRRETSPPLCAPQPSGPPFPRPFPGRTLLPGPFPPLRLFTSSSISGFPPPPTSKCESFFFFLVRGITSPFPPNPGQTTNFRLFPPPAASSDSDFRLPPVTQRSDFRFFPFFFISWKILGSQASVRGGDFVGPSPRPESRRWPFLLSQSGLHDSFSPLSGDCNPRPPRGIQYCSFVPHFFLFRPAFSSQAASSLFFFVGCLFFLRQQFGLSFFFPPQEGRRFLSFPRGKPVPAPFF